MHNLYKVMIFVAFVLASVVTAALFGAVHDQLSFTVSPEYFTRFKFIQFHLANSPLPDRVRAAMVGILASWWMGVPLGLLCGPAGFLQRTSVLMARALAWSLLLAIVVTLTIAAVGLAYGWLQTQDIAISNYRGWYIPAGVANLRAFICAGYMHNAAYLGGAISVPAVWIFHSRYKSATRQAE